jgi:MOSC domain-containing protein YiiM
MVKRFLVSRRTGFYLRVTREGEVGAGDEFVEAERDNHSVPVSEITRLYVAKKFTAQDEASLRRLMHVPALPDDWKRYFQQRLERSHT